MFNAFVYVLLLCTLIFFVTIQNPHYTTFHKDIQKSVKWYDDVPNGLVSDTLEPPLDARGSDKDWYHKDIIPLSAEPIDRKYIVVYRPVQSRFLIQAKNLRMNTCAEKNCNVYVMTSETEGPISADAVVFQGNQVPSKVPARVNAAQLYVFADSEPPLITHSKTAVQMMHDNPEFYNLTITYKRDSDIPAPYGIIIPRNANKRIYLQSLQMDKSAENYGRVKTLGLPGKDYNAIFNHKTKSSLWFVSHCLTFSKREQYVERMKHHTQVDLYGLCGGSRIKHNDTFDNDYKFYLAFENTFCEDYITEKFFTWYSKDIIVVVFGGANYSLFAPAGTYINAADFPSPEALADFLNKLGSDRERYIGYLKRKDQYQVITEQESVQNAFCGLCWRLNYPNRYSYSPKNISHWWFSSCTRKRQF